MPSYINYDELHKYIESCADSLRALYSKESGVNIFFRGHANRKWEYAPSIARLENKHKSERSIIEEALSEGNWDISRNLFENIARLQHYGTPTRFLDYTTDIDIALYFACSGHKNKDAEIQMVPYDLRDKSHPDTTEITELALLDQTISVYEFAEAVAKKHPNHELPFESEQDPVFRTKCIGMSVLSWISHGFMVSYSECDLKHLEKWNPRLLHQKGVFFVFGNKTTPPNVKAFTSNVVSTKILPEIEDTPYVLKQAKTVFIPKELKDDVISALEEKGITEAYIYPN